jgi:hypothetical protein
VLLTSHRNETAECKTWCGTRRASSRRGSSLTLGKKIKQTLHLAILFLLFIGVGPTGEAAVLEFSAYLGTERTHLFVLTNRETSESSGWLTVGQVFQGYTITEFDPANDVLVLQQGGKNIRVNLKASRIEKARKKPASPVRALIEDGLELRMTLSADGVLSLKGHAFPGETLDPLFKAMARDEEELLIVIEQEYLKASDTSRAAEFMKSIMARMRAAGFKGRAIKMNQQRDETSKK